MNAQDEMSEVTGPVAEERPDADPVPDPRPEAAAQPDEADGPGANQSAFDLGVEPEGPSDPVPDPRPEDATPVASGEPAEGQSALDLGVEPEGPSDPDLPPLDDPRTLRAAAEAVLLVVDTPVTTLALAQVLDVPAARVEQALAELGEEYDSTGRGCSLREIAGGWRLHTRDEYAPYVERYVLDGQQTRLTQAALETLAVVAYRQPVTRARIAGIRGVGVDGVMRTLVSRGLIEECGTDPETGGGLYRTTSLFLEKLGMRSLEDLPSLAPLLPELDTVEDGGTST